MFRSGKFEKAVFEVEKFEIYTHVVHFTRLVVLTVRYKRRRKADISSNIVHVTDFHFRLMRRKWATLRVSGL